MAGKQSQTYWDSFFSWFGFMDDPTAEKAIETIKHDSRKVIREDLKKIKSSYHSNIRQITKSYNF
jgi:hypothetical protein